MHAIGAAQFWMLSDEMIATSNRLQKEADNERLALFIGAGASFPSGLPSWAGLVEQLAITAGFTETERAALAKLSVLDQATLIQERFGSEHAFKKEVAKCVEVGRYTPAHAILSSLELAAITTNYDPLYENAARSGGLTVHLMPWDTAMLGEASGKVDEASMSKPGIARKNAPKPKRGSAPGGAPAAEDGGGPSDLARKPAAGTSEEEMTGVEKLNAFHSSETPLTLLKLHGCVSRPETIVLTRKDYIRYEDHGRALRGVVQHGLIYSELLFIGFSMTDENLHTIIDQVRKVTYEDGRPRCRVGSVFTLVENPMFRKLWQDDFNVVSCADAWDAPLPPDWVHDCLLDHISDGLATRRAADEFVLNERFASLLTREQRLMKEALVPLSNLYQDKAVRGTQSWDTIAELLSWFGQEFVEDDEGYARPENLNEVRRREVKEGGTRRKSLRLGVDDL